LTDCLHCLRPISQSSRGRAPKYCSIRCRVAAHRLHNFVTDHRDCGQSPKDIVTGAPDPLYGPVEAIQDAKEIVSILRRLLYVGRIAEHRLALLVPHNVALDELNIYRLTTGADLARALDHFEIEDYPQRAPSQPPDLRPRPFDERNPLHGSNPDGSTPGALQGDYPLEYYEDGYPVLPECLRRAPKEKQLDEAA
jgi:hypothetical protein